eukprot:gene16655-19787_t
MSSVIADPNFILSTITKLKERNARETTSFRGLVEAHALCQQRNRELRSRVKALDGETAELRKTTEQLTSEAENLREEAKNGAEAVQLRTRAATLQDELTNSYKTQAEVAQDLVRVREELQSVHEEHKQAKETLKETYEKLAAAEEHIQELLLTVDNERAACAEAGKELEARLADKEAAEARLAQLELEHSALVERWMQMKLQEAERLNEANAIYEDVVRTAECVKQTTTATLRDSTPDTQVTATLGSLRGHSASVGTILPSRRVAEVMANDGGTHCLAFDLTGSNLASGGVDRTVQVWEPVRGGNVTSLRGANEVDGGRWDAQETLTGHSDKVVALAWSPVDPLRAISCGNDRCIK